MASQALAPLLSHRLCNPGSVEWQALLSGTGLTVGSCLLEIEARELTAHVVKGIASFFNRSQDFLKQSTLSACPRCCCQLKSSFTLSCLMSHFWCAGGSRAGCWWWQLQHSCGGNRHRFGTFTSAQSRDHVLFFLEGFSLQ